MQKVLNVSTFSRVRKATEVFQGVLCPYGHNTRYLISRRCVECTLVRTATNAARTRKQALDRLRRNQPAPTRPAPEECELCGRKCHRALALDHDHETGAFRGWLCFECNTGLGKFGDNIEGLKKALDYLERAAL